MAPSQGRVNARRPEGGRRGGTDRHRTRRRTGPKAEQKQDQAPKYALGAEDVNEDEFCKLFRKHASPDAHKRAQELNRFKYLATIKVLVDNKVAILENAKTTALLAAWLRRDKALMSSLMEMHDEFNILELLKVATLLDCDRSSRCLEKRMACLKRESMKAGQKGKSRLGRKINHLKKEANNKNALKIEGVRMNLPFVRFVRRWARKIPKERLEYMAFNRPTAAWKKLADLCHFHPEKDFPNLPWFLRYCYDPKAAVADVPALSVVSELTDYNVNDLVQTHDIPFARLKPFVAKLTDDSKARIAKYTPSVDDLLWNYESLACAAVDEVLQSRLQNGDPVNLPCGKLLERLLMLRGYRPAAQMVSFYPLLLPHAESALKRMKLPLESPVAVFGDASGSMDTAMKTAVIVASILRVMTEASLSFFNEAAFPPPYVPTSAEKVVDLAHELRASGGTCMACCLWPFYERKQVVKTFILVTDEQENVDFYPYPQDQPNVRYRFTDMFKKYHSEVYPATLVFISFMQPRSQQQGLCMSLMQQGYKVLRVIMDAGRPDLSKLDGLFGELCMEGGHFTHDIAQVEEMLRREQTLPAVENLKISPA